MIYGTSTSVSVGLTVIVMSFVIGTIVGALAGFFGGWVKVDGLGLHGWLKETGAQRSSLPRPREHKVKR